MFVAVGGMVYQTSVGDGANRSTAVPAFANGGWFM